MASSLAQQLAQRNTLDSSRLASLSSLKHPPSFIFTPRHAASLTTSDLHLLASNAWDQLAAQDSTFEKFHSRILGEEAKDVDRSLLTREENDKLDRVLDKVLRALGKHMLVKPAGVVLEWLVRRFRINDLNVPSLIALFLPYHTTPHFPSALSLIPEKTLSSTPFSCLIPTRSSLSPLPLSSLIDLLPPFSSTTTSRDFLEFILQLPLKYLEQNEEVHRSLISFWLQVISGLLDRSSTSSGGGGGGGKHLLSESLQTLLLSTLLSTIRLSRSQPDLMLASYILLTHYSLHYPFTDTNTLKVVLKHVVSNRVRREYGDDETDEVALRTCLVISQLAGKGEVGELVGEGKKFLGTSGWKSLMQIERLPELLIELSNQYDSVVFMKPFLKTLSVEATSDSRSLTILNSVITPSSPSLTLPNPILTLLTKTLLDTSLSSTSTSNANDLTKPLSQIYQRHPKIWESLTASLISSPSLSKDDLETLWKVINNVIGIGGIAIDGSDVLLSTNSPDLAVRILGLKKLLASTAVAIVTEGGEGGEGRESFVRGIIRARLSEGKKELMEVILVDGEKGKKGIDLLGTGEEILDVLEKLLEGEVEEGVEEIVRRYLLEEFSSIEESMADPLVKRIVWKRILRRKNGGGWKISGTGVANHPWLVGVGSESTKGDFSEPEAIKANEKDIDKIVKNISGLPKEAIEGAIDFLLEGIRKDDLLSILVSAKLALRLSSPSTSTKDCHLSFINTIFETFSSRLDNFVALPQQAERILLDGGEISSVVGQALYSKPEGEKTIIRAKVVLLLSLAGSLKPCKEDSWTWLDVGGQGVYHHLAKSIYKLAHTGSSTIGAKSLSSQLLSSLFTETLGEDTLPFLASIYTSPHSPKELKVVALRDSKVFVGVVGESGRVDFQVVVPTLLVVLGGRDEVVRKGAMDVLEEVERRMPKIVSNVYGKDRFYGEGTKDHLKYLDVMDASKYFSKLLESRTEIIMDGNFLLTAHQKIFDSVDTDPSTSSKKKSSLKTKIITYILSHISSSSSILFRTLLLRSISKSKDSLKSTLLIPILEEIIKMPSAKREEMIRDQGVDDEVLQEYGGLLLQGYRDVSKKWLENVENGALKTFGEVLEIQDGTGLGAILRTDALSILRQSLFSSLRGESRLDTLRRLVRLAHTSDITISSEILACLRGCKVDSATLTSFLNELRLSIASPVSKGAKRGRTSIGNVAARAERLPELVIALESVDFSHVAAAHALLLSLFDSLSTIMEIPASAQVDIQYPGQLLLGALAKVVENAQPSSEITRDSVRMTPVLDFMRSSSNPQTSHQALLLLSQLGPLVPDQLVHNIMPIFTFMGANVLQRDDAYSLRVVEKTLESVVPALVKSKKRASGTRDALLSDLKELLRVFTDAAAHVPRHRRINLFVRFVTTLGANEFLSAVCVLLQAKGVKAADRSTLPLAVFEHFPVNIQLNAIQQVLEEASRHLNRVDDESVAAPFLDLSLDTEGARTTAEQIADLINFVGSALEGKHLSAKIDASRVAGDQAADLALSSIVRMLLDFSSVTPSTFTPNDVGEVASATNFGLEATVRQMSTQAFSESIIWLLGLSEPAIEASAFVLLCTRLPTIKPSRRGDISPAVIIVVDRLRAALADKSADLDNALDTIDAIATSIFADEDATLAKTVPVLLEVARKKRTTREARAKAIEIVKKLAHRLGPRLIPLAGKIVPFAVDMLRQQAQDIASSSPLIVSSLFSLLEGLFVSIPNFIGTQLDKVFEVTLSKDVLALTEGTGVTSKAKAMMLSTAARKLPAKTLYPAIIRLHGTLTRDDKVPIIGLLDLLNRSLRQGKTIDIAENFRPIFKLFLTIFDIRRLPSSLSKTDISQIEENALGAFVQFILKLNEQTFRPLFLRTFDWAVIDLGEGEGEKAEEGGMVARKIVLFKLMDRLLVQLKSIVVPYFSFMLDQTVEIFGEYAKDDMVDSELWTAVVAALMKAIEYDENGFWTVARLSKLSKPIASQLESSQTSTKLSLTSSFHPLLSSYATSLSPHEDLLKSFNSSLLMLTRSDDLRIKRGALEALEVMWETLGDGMLGLVPETTPFLSEALEEIDGGVEGVCRRLIGFIEERLGESLQSYLEN